jgi:exo-beta-1,3-glucanase (GH17 family)
MLSRNYGKFYGLMAAFLIFSMTSVVYVKGQDALPILGLNYGPYRLEQSPWGPYPSEDELNEDLALITQKVSTIRIYSVQGIGEQIVTLAQAHGINVVIQAWIGTDQANNELEVSKAIELANSQPNVIGVLVGSEVVRRNDVSVDALIQYIQEVRQGVPNNIPVGYADIFISWDQNPQLADVVDWVGLHSYAFFSCRRADEAAEFALAQVELLRENAAFTEKKIMLFESGWPTSGARAGCEADTQGSEEAQAQVVHDIIESTAQAQIDLFLFQAFDEPFKCYTGEEEAYFGCHWGLVNVDRTPKLAWDVLPNRDPDDDNAAILYVLTSSDTGANCRSDATTDSSVVEILANGTEVEVISSEGDWRYIRVGESECWMREDLLGERPIVSALTSYIQQANPDLCTGSSTREIAAQGFVASDSAFIASCLLNLRIWRADAAAQQAARIQDGTCEVQPTPDQLTSHFEENWAVSDMSAMYFMIGIRLKAEGQDTLAVEAFQTILNSYYCGWIWDPAGSGFFWSVKRGAEEQLGISSSATPTPIPGSLGPIIQIADPNLCPGTKSEDMSIRSWNSDLPTAASCVRNVLQWASFAQEQQAARLQNGQCDVQPANSALEAYFAANWALTDTAITYFNLGRRLKDAGQNQPAREAFQIILDQYSCAWAWDPSGPWFWSLALGAREQLATIS